MDFHNAREFHAIMPFDFEKKINPRLDLFKLKFMRQNEKKTFAVRTRKIGNKRI